MERVGVIADAHANLPATRVALDALKSAGCDVVVHVGDAVALGPYPDEVVSLLVEAEVRCVMGNHDEWSAFGLPEPPPPWLPEPAIAHQRWTRRQLSDGHRDAMKSWPYTLSLKCGEVTVVFIHYARRDGEWSDDEPSAQPSGSDFGRLFAGVAGDVVVFGHVHHEYDLTDGARRFLNPGSVGCHEQPEARALVLTPASSAVSVATLAVRYEDAELLRAFEERQVPWRDFILRTFIRRR